MQGGTKSLFFTAMQIHTKMRKRDIDWRFLTHSPLPKNDRQPFFLLFDNLFFNKRCCNDCKQDQKNTKPACRGLHKGNKASHKRHALSAIDRTHLAVKHREFVLILRRISLQCKISFIRMLFVGFFNPYNTVYNQLPPVFIHNDVIKLQVKFIGQLLRYDKIKYLNLIIQLPIDQIAVFGVLA